MIAALAPRTSAFASFPSHAKVPQASDYGFGESRSTRRVIMSRLNSCTGDGAMDGASLMPPTTQWIGQAVPPFLLFKTHERLEFSGSSLNLSTIRQSSATDAALSFRIMLLRWTFTVVSVMPISPAICLFSRPSTT